MDKSTSSIISEREMFVSILRTMEKRSSCTRVQVSSVIVKDGRIISSGWNGVPKGFRPHCYEVFDLEQIDSTSDEYLQSHREFSEKNEIHSEVNAIAYAARNGVSTTGASIYCSVSPCTNCSKLIIAAGITEVFYLRKYDRETDGLDLMKKIGITVEKIS